MADVFEEDAPVSEIDRLWRIIKQTPMLDWQLLTKRPERIIANLPQDWGRGYGNVWLGTSVEDERVVNRIAYLKNVPAVVHFLSLEPLIGPLSSLPLDNIQWVIVGGESGPRARPIDEKWVLDIRRQCRAASIPFFFKQWGGVNKARNGRALRGRFYDEIPRSTRSKDE
jgi:protein gp37